MDLPDRVPDCGRCAALCCVATCFDEGDDFAFDKASGDRCSYLTTGYRCSIHAARPERGFAGCVSYTCYGAGQHATARFALASEPGRNEGFLLLVSAHEILWLLSEAAQRCPPAERELHGELERVTREVNDVASMTLEELLAADVEALRAQAHRILRRVGEALGGRAGWVRRRLPLVG
jgi:hypothetical protein